MLNPRDNEHHIPLVRAKPFRYSANSRCFIIDSGSSNDVLNAKEVCNSSLLEYVRPTVNKLEFGTANGTTTASLG